MLCSTDELLGRDVEGLLAEGLDDKQEQGGESFEQLFARFAEMKGLHFPQL